MTVKGFDQYHRNDEIDYAAARREGYAFLIHKATEGKTYTDPAFTSREARARAAGLAVGGYCFSRPGENSPEDEVAHYASIARGRTFAPIIDLEFTQSGFSAEDMQSFLLTWLKTAKDLFGVKPILYTYPDFIHTYKLASDVIQNACALWIASYHDKPDLAGFKSAAFQQNSDKGTVAGVTPIDTDVCYDETFLAGHVSTPNPAPKPDAPNVYTVKAGDTLSEIAAKAHTTVNALAALNGIKDVNVIHVGQELKLSGHAATLKKAEVYIVKRNDTLSEIAARFHTSVHALAVKNHLRNVNFIRVGQKLNL